MKTLTLNESIKLTVETLLNTVGSFSIHDITASIREKANNGEFEITDVPTFGSPTRFNIRHNEVRTSFLNMLSAFALVSNFNGTYNVYSADPASPLATIPSPTSVPSVSVPTFSVSQCMGSSAVSAAMDYINKKASNRVGVTIKQVQSALKRYGNFRCQEIADELIRGGFKVMADIDGSISKSIVYP